jgi:Ca-activated chloride channel homolog
MRPSLLALAVATALLASCSLSRNNSQQAVDAPSTPTEPAPVDEVLSADVDAMSIEPAPVAEAAADAEADSGTKDGRGDRQEAAAKLAYDQVAVTGSAVAAPPRTQQEIKASEGYAIAQVAPPPPQNVPDALVRMAQPLAAAPVSAEPNTENYESLPENPVVRTAENPVSTFSIDVDTGSYTNVRALLAQGQRPPSDAVRAEEMLNYFDYGYPAPASRGTPFRVSTELAPAPWNGKRVLLQVGIQGYRVPAASIPAANLVFLIDTSGSMSSPNKLELVKASFRELVHTLREQDRVSIVVYAGAAGLVLPPTAGSDKQALLGALDRLEAGGSTNGGAGLELAYATARQSFVRGGVNRVIIATDGDFNVGTFDQKTLETKIADERRSGIALTTLGFGRGNYNDAMAEQLADVGNGNHAYIDTLEEGRRVLVEEMSSTLLTIAQDVKIQVEFNPAVVAEYRLIGYENRALRREDFNNDRIDAGEIGAGHDVTALYEIALVGSGGERSEPLRYGAAAGRDARGDEIGHLRLRYKAPGAERSQLMQAPLARSAIRPAASERLRFAASVAAYADLLRGGANVGAYDWSHVLQLAAGSLGEDRSGRRREFLGLIDRARALTGGGDTTEVAVSE